MAMSISTTTFAVDPFDMTIIKADKICSYQLTYSNIAFFSWGATIVGKEIEMRWNAMPSTQFNAIQTVLETDTTVVWTPNIAGSTVTYEVNLVGLDGSYHISQESTSNIYRTNCNLKMIIMSEVT